MFRRLCLLVVWWYSVFLTQGIESYRHQNTEKNITVINAENTGKDLKFLASAWENINKIFVFFIQYNKFSLMGSLKYQFVSTLGLKLQMTQILYKTWCYTCTANHVALFLRWNIINLKKTVHMGSIKFYKKGVCHYYTCTGHLQMSGHFNICRNIILRLSVSKLRQRDYDFNGII